MAFPNPPYLFTNLPAGNNPASYLDTMFAALGNASVIACTASGTNTITLTPNSNFFLPTAYVNYNTFSFAAVATSSGNVTALVPGLATLKVFMPSGVQAASGDIVNGNFYHVAYNSALDTGTGGFQILNATVSSIAQPVQATVANLKVTNNAGTPNTKVDITADQVVLQNAGGGTVRVTTVSLTCDLGTTGANGLDTGAIAAAKFYYMYVIYNATSTTTASLASLSSTSPVLPAGYTYFGRVSTTATAQGSAQLMGTLTRGIDRRTQYVVGLAQTTSANGGIPNLISGASGTYSNTNPVLVSVSVSAAVPPVATAIILNGASNYKGGTTANVLVAPSTSWGGTNNGPGGTSGYIWPFDNSNTGGSIGSMATEFTLVLESTSIGYASTASGGAVSCFGWME